MKLHDCCLLKKFFSDVFVPDNKGFYRVQRPVSESDIIQAAKSLLNERLKREEALVDYQEIKDFLMVQMSDHYETLSALFLDAAGLIAFEWMFSGRLDTYSALLPRHVARSALEVNATKVILAHSTAPGQPRPVQADRDIAKRVQDTLGTLEIEFDYCFISDGRVISLTEWGFLKKPHATP